MSQPTQRTKAKYPHILKGLTEGKTQGEIADELGYSSDRSVGRIMASPDFQTTMAEWIGTQLDEALTWIDTLWASNKDTDKREAARLKVAIVKHIIPRINFSKVTRESTVRYQGKATPHDIEIWERALQLIPPECRQHFAEAIQQALQEQK